MWYFSKLSSKVYTCLCSMQDCMKAHHYVHTFLCHCMVFSSYSVPAPVVTLTPFPVHSHFYTGLQLNLSCLIRLAEPIEYHATVSVDWSKSNSTLVSDSRVTIEEPRKVEPFLYRSSLVFNSLDGARGDEGEYVCTVTVSPDRVKSSLYRDVTVMEELSVFVESE